MPFSLSPPLKLTTPYLVSEPVTYSRDHRVRFRLADLLDIVFDHLFTVQEPNVLGPSGVVGPLFEAGVTEWSASVNGVTVSLSWDWMRLQDGALVALKGAPPRTNVMALDPRGYDLDDQELTQLLWDIIGALDWQPRAAAALKAGDTGGP